MKRYKVRFHLGRGETYMHWQVTDNETKTKYYAHPDSQSLLMQGCVLGNQPSVARKIFEGENKTVCAWISCDDVRYIENGKASPDDFGMKQYKYNPRKNPHWFTDDSDNCDKKQIKEMMTINRQVYG